MTSQQKYDALSHVLKREAGWEIWYTHLSREQQNLVDAIFDINLSSFQIKKEIDIVKDNLIILQEDLDFATEQVNNLYRDNK
jgi:hypothetical protein